MAVGSQGLDIVQSGFGAGDNDETVNCGDIGRFAVMCTEVEQQIEALRTGIDFEASGKFDQILVGQDLRIVRTFELDKIGPAGGETAGIGVTRKAHRLRFFQHISSSLRAHFGTIV